MKKIKIVMIVLIISFMLYGLTLAAGDYSGSGTYDYDSTAQTLELDFGPNNFPSACEIMDVTVSDVIVGDTSLQWSMGSDTFTWIRPSGTADDIVGAWTLEGENLVLTFSTNNTFTLVGTNFSCGDDEGPDDGDGGGDGDSGGGCFIHTLQK